MTDGRRQSQFEDFSKQKREQLKTVQNNSYGQKWPEATNLRAELMKSKVQVKGKPTSGTKFTFAVCRKRESLASLITA